MIGQDQISQPPPSPVNDPRGASGMDPAAGGPGGAGQPGAVGTLLGTSSGGAQPGLPPDAMTGVLQLGQQLTEQIKGMAQSIPIMAPKLMQANTLIEQALADFITSAQGAGPVPMGGQATPGAFSAGAAFPR